MSAIRGVCAAVLTPLTQTLEPDAEKAIPYYADLLARGCDALNVLGSTGEAWSLSVAQRVSYMQKISQSDLPLDRMMASTAGWNLEESVRLMLAARELGFAGSLIMPRLPDGDRSDDRVIEFFHRLFSRTSPAARSIYLYNFPNVSGITFTSRVVAKLLERFPGIIAGLKDSSNDLSYAVEIARLDPELAVFPSSESHLLFARHNNLAGCISGTVCLWPESAQPAWSDSENEAEHAQRRIERLRRTVTAFALVPAVRSLTAQLVRDESWNRVLPPLQTLDPEERTRLLVSYEASSASLDAST